MKITISGQRLAPIELNTNRLGCFSTDDLKIFVKIMARKLEELRLEHPLFRFVSKLEELRLGLPLIKEQE